MNFDAKNNIGKSYSSLFNKRLNFLHYFFTLFVVFIVLRLVKIQIFDNTHYVSISNSQYYTKINLPAKRGLIYDREGRILATNIILYQIGADPFYLKRVKADINEVAENLSKIFGHEKKFYLERLKEFNKRFVWLGRDVPPSSIAKFDSFVSNLKTQREKSIYRGIVKIEKFKRYYPYDNLASHVLGAVNANDNEGLFGVEVKFDKFLRGREGFMYLAKDGLGNLRASVGFKKIKPVDGYSLKLTIDVGVQTIIEAELERGIKEFGAESGVVLVIDPWTGDVLGLANYPNFNPNSYWLFDSESFKNRAIIDAFEPGSTFKVVPASLLLEKDSTKLYSKVNVEGGKSLVNGVRVVDYMPNGILSFEEILKYSSNIGMAKLALGIDKVEFYKHARNFGFGTRTGINLPAESEGELKTPEKWSPATKIFMSFGYELRATPLQIAMAYASIANGGVLFQPRIVKEIIKLEGKVIKSFPVIPIRRVMSERTAKILTKILEDAVNAGTGMQARVEGLRIAGKTGTAQIYEMGFYSKTKYRASFVGFFPAEKPRFVCFVMLESPKSGYSGGVVAAPVFKRIAERLSKLSPIENGEVEKVRSSNFNGGEKSALVKRNETYKGNQMPDVRNLSLRLALMKISPLELKIAVVGSGVVVDQDPKPGTRINPGAKCVLYCRDDFIINSAAK